MYIGFCNFPFLEIIETLLLNSSLLPRKIMNKSSLFFDGAFPSDLYENLDKLFL